VENTYKVAYDEAGAAGSGHIGHYRPVTRHSERLCPEGLATAKESEESPHRDEIPSATLRAFGLRLLHSVQDKLSRPKACPEARRGRLLSRKWLPAVLESRL
jgi:hypothetical protein